MRVNVEPTAPFLILLGCTFEGARAGIGRCGLVHARRGRCYALVLFFRVICFLFACRLLQLGFPEKASEK